MIVDNDGFEESKVEINCSEKLNSLIQLDERVQWKFIKQPNQQQEYLQTFVTHQTLEDRYKQACFTLIYSRYPRSNKIDFTHMECTPKELEDLNKQKKSSKQKFKIDSNFDSGNLLFAYQYKKLQTYELVIQNDTNTRGYTQWFAFRLKNLTPQVFNFSLVNFVKNHILFDSNQKLKKYSHFQNGMMPCLLKKLNSDSAPLNEAFISNLSYHITSNYRTYETDHFYYALTFQLNIVKPLKTLYVTMCLPYTYQKLITSLKSLVYLELTKSLFNVVCPYLKVGTGVNRALIIARQHPGETVGSYVVQGVIEFLISNHPEAKFLKELYEFFIVPMVNIDGVQSGNFRCDLNGHDLNRKWLNNQKVSSSEIHFQIDLKMKHPVLFAIKQLAVNLKFFLDLHGHSRKLNTFLYGCRNQNQAAQSRVYPYIVSKLCPFFSFEDCIFQISRQKISTARAYNFNNNREALILTSETSYFGYGDNQTFTFSDLKQIGVDLMKGLFIYNHGHKTLQTTKYEEFDLSEILQQLKSREKYFEEVDRAHEDSQSDSEAEEYLAEEKLELDITPLQLIQANEMKTYATPKTSHQKQNRNNLKQQNESYLRQTERFLLPSKVSFYNKDDHKDLSVNSIKERYIMAKQQFTCFPGTQGASINQKRMSFNLGRAKAQNDQQGGNAKIVEPISQVEGCEQSLLDNFTDRKIIFNRQFYEIIKQNRKQQQLSIPCQKNIFECDSSQLYVMGFSKMSRPRSKRKSIFCKPKQQQDQSSFT